MYLTAQRIPSGESPVVKGGNLEVMNSSFVENTRKSPQYAGVPLLSRAFFQWCKAWSKSILYTRKSFENLHELIDCHYRNWSSPSHRTRPGMELALASCDRLQLIVETGTSAWGCDSSRLFDMVARQFGATFASVDIRPEASLWLKHQVSKQTQFFVQDSLEFFRDTFSNHFKNKVDFAYLDSFDLDYSDPAPSESHCLQEFLGVCRFSRAGTIVLIDDTPANLEEIPDNFREISTKYFEEYGRIPGKGSLVRELVKSNNSFKILWESENLVIQILRANPFDGLVES